jgi:hypothetical protein
MAEPSGAHVVRGGKTGGLNQYNYDAASDGPVAGWETVEDNGGAVGMTGEGGDGFSAAMSHGNAGNPQPGSQT